MLLLTYRGGVLQVKGEETVMQRTRPSKGEKAYINDFLEDGNSEEKIGKGPNHLRKKRRRPQGVIVKVKYYKSEYRSSLERNPILP